MGVSENMASSLSQSLTVSSRRRGKWVSPLKMHRGGSLKGQEGQIT